MKKRIISIAVSLCTILSLFPVSVYAEGLNMPYYNAGESVSGNQSVSGNGNEMALEGENNFTVTTEEQLINAVATNGAVITLGKDIELSSELKINYANPTQNFSTTIKTNNHKLTGTIILNGCALTVNGTLDADVEANYKENSQDNGVWWGGAAKLYGGTYKGNITLNKSVICSGTYEGQITGGGDIENGTFNNIVTCNRVFDGVFYKTCTVSNENDGNIENGIFYSVPNYAYKEMLPSRETSYYITYKNGDSIYATEYMFTESEGLKKTQHTLTNPTKTDYTFEGWYKDSDYTSAFDKNSLSANDFGENGNLTLYAKWEHNDDAHIDETSKDHNCDICGKKITECIDENGDRKCDICNTHITAGYIKNDTTLLIYNGTDFDSENFSFDTITKIINYGTFKGLCPDTVTKIINYGTIEVGNFPSSTIIVENKENGVIDSGHFGGSVTNDGTILSGNFFKDVTNNGTIENGNILTDVTNNGTIKGGSFYGNVTNDGTIKGGSFNSNKLLSGIYTVTFDSKGGRMVSKQWRAKAPATKPDDPTYEGKTFCGWFIKNNDDSYSLYDFSADITEDITLYANWDCEIGHIDTTPQNHKCDICNTILSTCSGGDAATCIKKSNCDYCGEEYGSLDSNNHTGRTEIKNDKAATCTEDGYTGDTYCKDCDTKLQDGKPITKLGHTDANKDHICDVETCKAIIGTCSGGDAATCSQKSICIYCGREYGSLDENNHTLEHHQKNAATESATGNKEYWQCTDCGKLFMDENGTNATNQKDITIKKLPVMLNGMGQSIKAGESKELSFRSDAEIGDFLRVELDGNTVAEKNYTVREGSTIVTLNAEYVASLPKGEHTISIVSTNGTASATFTLLEESPAANTPNEPENPSNNTPANPSSNEKANTAANEPAVTATTQKASPATGDNSHFALWMAIMIVGAFLIRNAKFGMQNYRQKK